MKDCRLAETLLYFASDRGRKSIPFNWLPLTASIATSLYEYLTGRTDFPEKFWDKRYASFSPAWYEDQFNKWLSELLEKHGAKLNPSLRQTFKEMLTIQWVSKDGPSDGYNTNGVDHWKHNMIQFGHFSDNYGMFNFTVQEAEAAREHIERELSEEALHHCEEIARLMEKHIDKSSAH